MPDTKISAMTAAASILDADLVPIVQGGVNKKATKQQVLMGGAGEDIALQGSAGQAAKLVNAAGSSGVFVTAAGAVTDSFGTTYQLVGNVMGTFLSISAAGQVTFSDAGMGQTMAWGVAGAAVLSISGPAQTASLIATNGVFINFVDNGAGNWATTPPNNWQTAIYRLAAQVQALSLGVPIP
jgi:hypothetical protein